MGEKNESRTYRRSFGYWLRELLALPGAAFDYAVGKWVAMSAAHTMMTEAIPLQLSAPAVAKLMYAWSKPGAVLEAGELADGPERSCAH